MAIPGQLLDSIDHYVMSLSMLQTFVRIICILGSLLQLLSSLTLTGHTGDVGLDFHNVMYSHGQIGGYNVVGKN